MEQLIGPRCPHSQGWQLMRAGPVSWAHVWYVQPHWATCSEGPHTWGLVLYVCHPEILKNIFFPFVFSKWRRKGQWGMHEVRTWSLGSPAVAPPIIFPWSQDSFLAGFQPAVTSWLLGPHPVPSSPHLPHDHCSPLLCHISEWKVRVLLIALCSWQKPGSRIGEDQGQGCKASWGMQHLQVLQGDFSSTWVGRTMVSSADNSWQLSIQDMSMSPHTDCNSLGLSIDCALGLM